jgi:tetratricopeptide (TPR) repeat protein
VTPDTESRRAQLASAAAGDASAAAQVFDDGAAEPPIFADAAEPPVFADAPGAGFIPADPAGFEPTADGQIADANVAAIEFSIDEQSFVGEPAEGAGASVAAGAAPVEPSPRAAQPAGESMASIFGEFLDAGEETSPSNDDDFETHYNLGLAYKEMGLWDEAVEQFQKAIDLCAPSDGTPRYLECCNMLGHALLEKGIPRAAALWFKKALALPRLSDDESQALRYDLGAAYEQAGDIDRAIDTFSEVYGVDVSYRGVAGRLRELQERRPVPSGR